MIDRQTGRQPASASVYQISKTAVSISQRKLRHGSFLSMNPLKQNSYSTLKDNGVRRSIATTVAFPRREQGDSHHCSPSHRIGNKTQKREPSSTEKEKRKEKKRKKKKKKKRVQRRLQSDEKESQNCRKMEAEEKEENYRRPSFPSFFPVFLQMYFFPLGFVSFFFFPIFSLLIQ